MFQDSANREHGGNADRFGHWGGGRPPDLDAHGHGERRGSLIAAAVQEEHDRAVAVVVILVRMHPMVQPGRGRQRQHHKQMRQHEHRGEAAGERKRGGGAFHGGEVNELAEPLRMRNRKC